VIYRCGPGYTEALGKMIKVQIVTGKNARHYLKKNNLKLKGLEVWLKLQGSCLASSNPSTTKTNK
jgi:hypothetical protein